MSPAAGAHGGADGQDPAPQDPRQKQQEQAGQWGPVEGGHGEGSERVQKEQVRVQQMVIYIVVVQLFLTFNGVCVPWAPTTSVYVVSEKGRFFYATYDLLVLHIHLSY